ncbi:hypothetical protein [Tabrizicola sp.]|uniref:hypothetical protein n=1 Tax=Tabrizicola sp. TaxID=2005166 RepID=UPI002FDE5587
MSHAQRRFEETMSQDSEPGPKTREDATFTGRLLDEVKAEPVPAKIVELAGKLEAALAAKRKAPKDRS